MGTATGRGSGQAMADIGVAAEGRQVDERERSDGSERDAPVDTAQLGLWVFLSTVAMLFAGFTSAYLVRRGTGADWVPLPRSPALWVNTAVLLCSSVTIEIGRAQLRRRLVASPKSWLLLTTLLGFAFLAGQLWVWRELAARGVYVSSHPHSSFFYILTGVHGAHLLAGLIALVSVLFVTWRAPETSDRRKSVNLCATYWHFVGGLWLYLFYVLFILG